MSRWLRFKLWLLRKVSYEFNRAESYVKLYREDNEFLRDEMEHAADQLDEIRAQMAGVAKYLEELGAERESLTAERDYLIEVAARLNPRVEEGQYLVVNDEAVEELQRLVEEHVSATA